MVIRLSGTSNCSYFSDLLSSQTMGLDITLFVGEVDEEFVCTICSGVLENPVQFPQCEHSFCEACIKNWLSRQRTCPIDRKIVALSQLKPAPRVLRNLLARLPIKCKYSASGCSAKVTLENQNRHEAECPSKSRPAPSKSRPAPRRPSTRKSIVELYEEQGAPVKLPEGHNILLSKNECEHSSKIHLIHNFMDNNIAWDFYYEVTDTVDFVCPSATRYGFIFPREMAYYVRTPSEPYHIPPNISLEAKMRWPHAVEMIKEMVEEYLWPSHTHEFNTAFLNYYRQELDSVGWHNYGHEIAEGKDPRVAIVSLGQSRKLEMKLNIDHRTITRCFTDLGNGSLLFMEENTVFNWLYRIPKEEGGNLDGSVHLIFKDVTPT